MTLPSRDGSSRLPFFAPYTLVLMSCITGKFGAGRRERGADVALGGIAGRDHVLFRARPPDAEQLVPRIAGLRGRLERDGAHHAVGPHDHVVGLGLADLQPLRFLRLAREARPESSARRSRAWRPARRAREWVPCRTPTRGRGTRSSCPSAWRARPPSGRGRRSSPPSGPSTWCRAGTPSRRRARRRSSRGRSRTSSSGSCPGRRGRRGRRRCRWTTARRSWRRRSSSSAARSTRRPWTALYSVSHSSHRSFTPLMPPVMLTSVQ